MEAHLQFSSVIGLHQNFIVCQCLHVAGYNSNLTLYMCIDNRALRECENISKGNVLKGLFKNQISSCKWGNNHSDSVWKTALITQGIQQSHRELT